MGLAAVLERSRSGNGGHVWFFFAEAIPAAFARLGSHILTETMERRPDVGLDSYDRFFPNQDTLPQGGLGNLIALPLQKQPREKGNSVFLDERCLPYPDPWAFLSAAGKIDRSMVEEIVRDAERRGRIIGVRIASPDEGDAEPWVMSPSRRKDHRLAGPMPRSLDLVLCDQIYFAKEQLTPGLRNQLLRLAAFQNPEFYKAQAMRLPTHEKPRIICYAEDHPLHMALLAAVWTTCKLYSRTCTSRRSFAISGTRACRWTCSSTANCGRSKRSPHVRCWPTTRVYCRRRPPLERR